MTPEKFRELITNRANVRVQTKLATFKRALYNALASLTGDCNICKDPEKGTRRHANVEIFARMLEEGDIEIHTWPSIIWRQEEEAVEKELLGMMDEMQKALIARPPKEDDNMPDGGL